MEFKVKMKKPYKALQLVGHTMATYLPQHPRCDLVLVCALLQCLSSSSLLVCMCILKGITHVQGIFNYQTPFITFQTIPFITVIWLYTDVMCSLCNLYTWRPEAVAQESSKGASKSLKFNYIDSTSYPCNCFWLPLLCPASLVYDATVGKNSPSLWLAAEVNTQTRCSSCFML